MQSRNSALLVFCCCISLIIFTRQQCPILKAPDENRADAATITPMEQPLLIPKTQPLNELLAQKTSTHTSANRTIKIKNNITDKMLKHPKAFGYMPAFAVSVNNTDIAQGKEQEVTVEDNKLIIEYRYNYLKGYRTGSKKIQFSVPADKQEVNLAFSWTDDNRILTAEAKLEKILEEINK